MDTATAQAEIKPSRAKKSLVILVITAIALGCGVLVYLQTNRYKQAYSYEELAAYFSERAAAGDVQGLVHLWYPDRFTGRVQDSVINSLRSYVYKESHAVFRPLPPHLTLEDYQDLWEEKSGDLLLGKALLPDQIMTVRFSMPRTIDKRTGNMSSSIQSGQINLHAGTTEDGICYIIPNVILGTPTEEQRQRIIAQRPPEPTAEDIQRRADALERHMAETKRKVRENAVYKETGIGEPVDVEQLIEDLQQRQESKELIELERKDVGPKEPEQKEGTLRL